MTCVNTFPKHSIDGDSIVPVCIILSTSSGHMTLHDIYGHFLNGKEQTALVHYN